MTEQRTITESEATAWASQHMTRARVVEVASALTALGITVIPDPTPPLPTERGFYVDGHGCPIYLGLSGWWAGTSAHQVLLDPKQVVVPVARLYTAEEADERVLAILRELGYVMTGGGVEQALREAREAGR